MLKLKKVNLIKREIKVRLPTENPNSFNEGTITVGYKCLSQTQAVDILERGLTKQELYDEVVGSVEGLGDENGNPISGEAANKEVKEGLWSAYLLSAINDDFLEQFGEARVKNSKPSRGR